MNAYISSAKQWLVSKHINVPDDWLEACIEWIIEENQGNVQSQQKVNELVFEQWLLSDLHELGSQCLPAVVISAGKLQLNGSFALQIDSMVDVGQSCYSQLQKVKGTENANAEVSADTHKPWEPKPSRMLLLKLTDGTHNVQGMEYGPISSLNSKLQPGCKIQVQGMVICRRGMLMLKRENVSILGGEVDTLMESNNIEQVIKSTLEVNLTNADKEYKQEYECGPTINVKQEDQKTNNSYRGSYSRPGNAYCQAEPRHIKAESQTKPTGDEFDEDLPLELLGDMDDFEDELTAVPNTNLSNSSRSSTSTNTGNVRGIQNQSGINMNPNRSTLKSVGNNFIKNETGVANSSGLTRNNSFQNSSSFTSAANFNNNCLQGNATNQNGGHSAGYYGNRSNQDDIENLNFLDDDFDDEFETQFLSNHRKSDQMPRNSLETKVNTSKKRPLVSPNEADNKTKRRSIQLSNKGDSASTSSSSIYHNNVVQQKRPLFKTQSADIKQEDESLNVEFDLEKDLNLNLERSIEKKFQSSADVDMSYDPWTYLSVVKKQMPTQQLVCFKVKAYISTLTGKLDCPGGKRWSLPCKINDGTMSLDVDLSDKVLTQLIGFSAVESQNLRKMARTDIGVREKLTQGIKSCQEKLVELMCIMEVQILPQVSRPEVISLAMISQTDISVLADKLQRKMKQ